MILDLTKAKELLQALDAYCRYNHIKLPKGQSVRYIALAKIVMDRYHSIVIASEGCKYLCNNPKYLKKFALGESLKKTPLLIWRLP